MNNQNMNESCERFARPAENYGEDIVLFDAVVGDVSGSMDDIGFEPGKSKRQLTFEALCEFLEVKRAYRPQDYMAVIGYQSCATQCCPFLNVGSHYDDILAALRKLESLPSGGTRLSTGLQIVLDLLRRDSNVREQIFGDWSMATLCRTLAYSDGHDLCCRWGVHCAERLKSQNVVIETFGVGMHPSNVDEGFLKQVATNEDGLVVHYRFLGDGKTLRQTFIQIATGTLTFNE